MVDNLALLVSHLVLLIVIWRLMMRPDPEAPDARPPVVRRPATGLPPRQMPPGR